MTCFRLIDAKKSQHPVSLLCSVLGVSCAVCRPLRLLLALIAEKYDESEVSWTSVALVDHASV